MKKIVSIFLICFLLFGTMLIGGCTDDKNKSSEKDEKGEAKPLSFRIALAANTGSALEQTLREFERIVESKSEGRIQVECYPDAQLGSETSNQESLQSGALEMAFLSSSIPSIVPQLNVFDLPYLVKDRTQIDKLIANPVMDEISDLLESKGLVLVSFNENGFRHITNNKRPIVKPEDLEGLKIRTPNNPSRLATFKVLKANPSPIPFSELLQALQQGVVDGQENPLTQIDGGRLFEVQKYLSLSGHVYTPGYYVASKMWWDRLSDEDKKIIMEAGNELGKYSRDLGEKLDNELVGVLKEKGMEVNEVDYDAFRQATEEIWIQEGEKIGNEFVQKIIKALGE